MKLHNEAVRTVEFNRIKTHASTAVLARVLSRVKADTLFSAGEIAKYLVDTVGVPVGNSTVQGLLAELASEGTLQKLGSYKDARYCFPTLPIRPIQVIPEPTSIVIQPALGLDNPAKPTVEDRLDSIEALLLRLCKAHSLNV